jgi:hypothetical protein
MVRRVKKYYSKEVTMIQPKPPKKRVVSKPEYLVHVTGTVMLGLGELLLLMGTIALGLLTVKAFLASASFLIHLMVIPALILLIITVLSGLGVRALFRGANKLWNACDEREEVVLGTRPNPEQLPAKEILLRASAEPTSDQEKTLLRAASGAAEQTPQDQLLRPGYEEYTMTEPKPPKKRIVSKSKYVVHVAAKTTLEFGGTLLGFGGHALLGVTWVCIIMLFLRPEDWSFLIIVALGSGWGAWAFLRGATQTEYISSKIPPVLSPTRQNIEQLPAEETLVRASTESTVEQEKTLLRAASRAEQTPPDQLLRPHL